MASIDDIRQRTWDFALTMVTIALLAALGMQSFVGTGYVWWATRTIHNWQQGSGYGDYVIVMNQIATPMIVLLVIVMGLCVPKRLFARKALIGVSAAMLVLGVAAGVAAGSVQIGLSVYLLLAAGIQLAVVGMTIAGVRGPSYLTEGRLTKTGSGLLHLGFIIFAVVVVALQSSAMMAPVFYLSATLAALGTMLSFYAGSFARSGASPELEAEFAWDDEDEELPQPSSESENDPENGSV